MKVTLHSISIHLQPLPQAGPSTCQSSTPSVSPAIVQSIIPYAAPSQMVSYYQQTPSSAGAVLDPNGLEIQGTTNSIPSGTEKDQRYQRLLHVQISARSNRLDRERTSDEDQENGCPACSRICCSARASILFQQGDVHSMSKLNLTQPSRGFPSLQVFLSIWSSLFHRRLPSRCQRGGLHYSRPFHRSCDGQAHENWTKTTYQKQLIYLFASPLPCVALL